MNQEFWKQFERTGLVGDYLQYLACASEDGQEMRAADGGSGEISGNCSDRHDSISNADWRIR